MDPVTENAATKGTGSTPAGLVARFQPQAQQRLKLPTVPVERAKPQPGTASKGVVAHTAPSSAPKRKTKLSFLKRLERNILALFKLGRIETLAKQARGRLDHVEGQMGQIGHAQGSLEGDVSRVWTSIAQLEAAHDDHSAQFNAHGARFDQEYEKAKAGDAALARSVSDLTRRLDAMLLHRDKLDLPPVTADASGLPVSDGFNAFLDSFYHRLENRYRGSVEEIANRLRIYLPDVEAAVMRTGDKPVMDLGCGRGEWLGLLHKAGVPAFGVDINPVQISAAQEKGLDVRLGDSMEALAEMEDNSLAVISAHHLVEHLPFNTVAWIAREAIRVLAPGGLLLFETPHTRNVLVGATTFHTDPTHLKPMPEQVLGVLFETAGFHPIEIRALHAHERFDEFLAKPDFNNELAFLMFGPQDLAVLGTKPTGD